MHQVAMVNATRSISSYVLCRSLLGVMYLLAGFCAHNIACLFFFVQRYTL